MKSRIIGTGGYVPSEVLTNEDLSRMVDTSDEWIVSRTGIKERRIAVNMNNSDMAYRACADAIANAGIKAQDVGLIIAATSTPDYSFPNCSSLVQRSLGIQNVVCFDVSSACLGFITALNIADTFLKNGTVKYALVAGSEKMSGIVDWHDRNVCVLFGDGAGAVVLKAEDKADVGIMDCIIHNDGTRADVLTGGARAGYARCIDKQDMQAVDTDNRHTPINTAPYIHMNGQEVFRFAVTKVPESINELLDNNHMSTSDVDMYVLHQANIRIIESVAKRLKADITSFPSNLVKYGNTSAASIPLLLNELNHNKRLNKSDTIVLSGFGAGLSWGSMLVKW